MKASAYFVEFILRSCELKGMTHSEMARKIGTTRQHVHWWSIGRNKVSFDMAQKCLDQLDLSWREFGEYLRLRRSKEK